MTTQEAKALIDSSENKIITSYSQFYASAEKLRDEGLAEPHRRHCAGGKALRQRKT